jgi:hypothetical protein
MQYFGHAVTAGKLGHYAILGVLQYFLFQGLNPGIGRQQG